MNFELSDEQAMFRDSVRRWVEKGYGFEHRREIVRSPEGFSREKWAEMAELGWLMAGIPESAGGLGFSAIETAVIAEELGRALVIEPFLAVAVLAAKTIEFAGGNADLLAAIGSGELLVALAHNEHDARGDVSFVATRADTGPGGWSINGRKSVVLAGQIVDKLLVSAKVGASDDVGLFLVDPTAPGLSLLPYRLIDGSPACDILLEDVAVAAEALLSEDAGPALAASNAHAIIALAAETVGLMDQALWTTRDYLLTRQQFGVTIATFQSLQHRAADMYVAVEQARAMLHFGLAHLDLPPDQRDLAMSAVKAQIGQLGHFVCGQAIQLHGGIGVTEEYIIGHHFKRMTVIEALFGHTQVHLTTVAEAIRRGG